MTLLSSIHFVHFTYMLYITVLVIDLGTLYKYVQFLITQCPYDIQYLKKIIILSLEFIHANLGVTFLTNIQ